MSGTFNIVFDDPDDTQAEDFRFSLCAATDREIGPNDSRITELIIPGGRCARRDYSAPGLCDGASSSSK
jgi:AraC family transcriptional regulator